MEILHHDTGAIIVSSKRTSIKEAVEENRADLRGADLEWADLRGAYLEGADLEWVNLEGADLRGVNLKGANLEGMNLEKARLGNLRIIDGGLRSDGYRFFYTDFTDEGPRIKAGCRNFTIEKARAHWQRTREGGPLGEETLLMLDRLEHLAGIRWPTEKLRPT